LRPAVGGTPPPIPSGRQARRPHGCGGGKDGKLVVTSRLTGNFPGSPVNLRFFFGLEGDKIASMEIIP
jgi:hypothetical protein